MSVTDIFACFKKVRFSAPVQEQTQLCSSSTRPQEEEQTQLPQVVRMVVRLRLPRQVQLSRTQELEQDLGNRTASVTGVRRRRGSS